MDQTAISTGQAKKSVRKFVTCRQCGAILGYSEIDCGSLYFYLFAYPADSFNAGLDSRRVAGRILAGDAFCSRCGNWQAWNGGRREKR